jgi:chromate transporter
MNVVTAAVVGVVLNLTVYFGAAVIFPEGISFFEIDYFSLAWIIISFIAMYKFKVNMIAWIGISAAFGLFKYILF